MCLAAFPSTACSSLRINGHTKMTKKQNDLLTFVLRVWGALSLVLLLAGVLVGYVGGMGKTFFVMLNALNLVSLILAFVFRRLIRKKVVATTAETATQPALVEQIAGETAIGIFFFIVGFSLCAIMTWLAFMDVKTYRTLIREDGIVEYGSAVLWFLAAIAMSLRLFSRPVPHRPRAYHLGFVLLFVAFFLVCCGEEISWGQRIFDIETSDWLTKVNVQNELTLHNIGSISVFANVFFLLVVSFFVVIPVVSLKFPESCRSLKYLSFPTPSKFAIGVFLVALTTWVIIGLRFGTLGFHPYSFYTENYYTQMDDEVFEFLIAFSFFSFSVLNSRRGVVSSSMTHAETFAGAATAAETK